MVFDKYTREAKLYPAIATLLPFLLLYYFALEEYLSGFVDTVLSLAIGGVTIAIALIFLLMEANRFISKMMLEKRYFDSELMMPTTNLLVFKDSTYSDDHKERIRKKIYADFGKQLLSKREEADNETLARQLIAEAVSMIRAKMKGGRLILQHNTQYGAARNLIGGSYIALGVSIVAMATFLWVAPNPIAVVLSLVLCVIYATLIISGKYIMTNLGTYYARVLFQEYIGS